MKKKSFLLSIFLTIIICFSCINKSELPNKNTIKSAKTSLSLADTIDETNNFYDNAETFDLKMNKLKIEGEITNPSEVDFSKLPIHSVIVKETLIGANGDSFTGAFRYDGYSLYDILNNCNLNKKNADVFKPIIDLFVEIENEKGEKAIIS